MEGKGMGEIELSDNYRLGDGKSCLGSWQKVEGR